MDKIAEDFKAKASRIQDIETHFLKNSVEECSCVFCAIRIVLENNLVK